MSHNCKVYACAHGCDWNTKCYINCHVNIANHGFESSSFLNDYRMNWCESHMGHRQWCECDLLIFLKRGVGCIWSWDMDSWSSINYQGVDRHLQLASAKVNINDLFICHILNSKYILFKVNSPFQFIRWFGCSLWRNRKHTWLSD